VQAVRGDLSGLAAQFSDESALEVCIHVMRYYTNRRLYFFYFTLTAVTRGWLPQRSGSPIAVGGGNAAAVPHDGMKALSCTLY